MNWSACLDSNPGLARRRGLRWSPGLYLPLSGGCRFTGGPVPNWGWGLARSLPLRLRAICVWGGVGGASNRLWSQITGWGGWVSGLSWGGHCGAG